MIVSTNTLILSFSYNIHFYHVTFDIYPFISFISYSSTYHLIYYISNGSYYISYFVHVIVIYIYYFHGYILYHLLCSIFMYCSCIVFIYSFPVILFILLSLLCTVLVHILFVYCHILSDMILYHHILFICIFTLTIEVAFMTYSRGNLVLFVIQ